MLRNGFSVRRPAIRLPQVIESEPLRRQCLPSSGPCVETSPVQWRGNRESLSLKAGQREGNSENLRIPVT